MKIKRFRNALYCEEGFFYKINNLDDIFDVDRFRNFDFETLKDLLNISWTKKNRDSERKARKICKDIFVNFLDLVVNDMICENDIFIFPEQRFGYMRIQDVANGYQPYLIDQDGKWYGIRLILDPDINKINKKYYRARLNQVNTIKMLELVNKNHKY